jgi:hypothetical protein
MPTLRVDDPPEAPPEAAEDGVEGVLPALLPQAASEAIPSEPLRTTAAILVTRRKGLSLVDAHLTGAE